MARAALALLAAAAIGCSGRAGSSAADDGNPAAGDDGTEMSPDDEAPDEDDKGGTVTSRQRVDAWAGQDASISRRADLDVAGADMYAVGEPPETRGAAVVDGHHEPLEGRRALEAIRGRAAPGPTELAKLALFLLGGQGTPITDPDGAAEGAPAEVRGLVTAPAIESGKLVFWTLGTRGDLLQRYTLDLGTLSLEMEIGQTLADEGKDPIDRARDTLAGPARATHARGAASLAEHCDDGGRAAALLNETLAGHDNGEARARAAAALASCHDADSVAVLTAALATDDRAEVRQRAAEALGRIGDASAREALEKAARSDDDIDVRGAAGRVLGELE